MSVPGHTLATHTTRGKSSGVYPLSNQGGGAPAELRAAVALMVELMGLPPVDPPRRTGPSTCGPCGSIMPLRPHGITYIAERQGFVKIGSTGSRHSLTTRLRTLRTPGAVRCPEGMDERLPLNIVAVLDDPVEHKLHEWYAEYHVIGEWFHAEPVKAALFSAVSV